MNLDDFKHIFAFISQKWVIQVFLVVFLTLVMNFIQLRVFNKLIARFKKTKNMWDEAFAWSISKPLGFLIWLVGLTLAARTASFSTNNPENFQWLDSTRSIGGVLILGWFLLRFIRKVESRVIAQEGPDAKIDKTTAHALAHIFRLTIFITTALVILNLLDIPVTGVVAFGGAGTVVVGLASKDLLANFFGAVMIFLDRPFAVGDWIRSPDKEIEGTVEHIGWRLTRIRTFSKRPLYVPNSVFATILVENPSRMTNRQIKEVIGVRYQDASKVKEIASNIQSMLMNHPEIDTTKALFVNLIQFSPSSLDILVYTFTKTTLWIPYQGIKQEIMLKIFDIVQSHGAEIAFPTTTLDFPEGFPQTSSSSA